MNEIEFGNALMEQLNAELPQCEISMNIVTKCNDRQLHGISIKRSDNVGAPVIYREDVYDQFVQGEPMEKIVDHIRTIVLTTEAPVNTEHDFVPSDDTLEVRLLDPEINAEFLKDLPHITLESGLVITCDSVLDDGHGGEYRAIINNGLLRQMGCGKQELFNKALRNMQKKKALLLDMSDALGLNDNNLIDSDTDLDPTSVYMLTNKRRILGSAQIVLKEVRSKIVSLIGGDFYIIPSSLHELLIVPAEVGFSKEDLETMLRDVNRTIVRPEDILSNKVYFVSGEDYSLQLA